MKFENTEKISSKWLFPLLNDEDNHILQRYCFIIYSDYK